MRWIWLLWLVGGAASIMAQPVQLQGTIGVGGQLYSASGRAGRQAPALAETYARLSGRFYGLQTGFTLRYSTDDNRLRQSMNRLGFRLGWRWGQVELGDASPTFTPLSLQGVTVRGGAMQLTPGRWMLALAGGRSRRAVPPRPGAGFRGASYEQWLYAVRLGFGRRQGTRFYLSGIYGFDARSSLPDTTTLAPVENLALTPELALVLFGGRLRFEAVVTASAFTGETRNDPIEGIETPLFTPRLGTHVDYAGQVALGLTFPAFGLEAQYRRIQPGFSALGVPRLRSDEESIRLQPRLQLLQRRLNVSLQLGQSRNNLLGQRLSTLTRRQLGGTVQALAAPWLTLSSGYQLQTYENRPEPGSDAQLYQRQDVHAATLAPVLTFRGRQLHNVALTLSYQAGRDRRGVQSFDNLTTALSYTVQWTQGPSLTLTGTRTQSQTAQAEVSVWAFNLGLAQALAQNALRLTLNGGWSRNTIAVAEQPAQHVVVWNGRLGGNWQLPFGGSLQLELRAQRSQLTGQPVFQELQTALRYERTF